MAKRKMSPAQVAAYTRQVQQELSNRIAQDGIELETADVETLVAEAVDEVTRYDEEITAADRRAMRTRIVTEFLEYGPIQKYIDDDEITDIIVQWDEKVLVERAGRLSTLKKRVYDNVEDVYRLIGKIASENNDRCDNQKPKMDARLKDGSRVNVVIPPISRFGPVVTIRKFPARRLSGQDLIDAGSATPEMMEFLRACVMARCNILVSGGTGSGKTTLLNVLSGFIPEKEYVITVEDTAELKLSVEKKVSLEARLANSDGSGEETIHDLVVNTLRMRPDRIIVGECRSDETVEMLQAMNTGHDGSMTTIHANDPRSAFLRIETMVQATQNLSERNIDKQIATAVQIIVQVRRYFDGTRKISEIVALTGTMEQDVITTVPLFVYEERGVDADGKIVGAHVATGSLPPSSIMEKIATEENVYFDEAWFTEGD